MKNRKKFFAFGEGINGSFYGLLNPYGIATDKNSGSVIGTTPDGTKYNIAAEPLYFVRSGDVDLMDGRLRLSGIRGYGWSSRSYSSTTGAYFLTFNASKVDPSDHGGNRWHGFPLRCLARL